MVFYNSIVIKIYKYLLSLLFLFFSQQVFSAPVSNNTTTNWNKASGWTPSGIPNLVVWDGSQDVIVSHNKTSGNLTIKNGNSIRVTPGTVLTINGSLTLGNRSSIIVDAGAVLVITGSLLANNSPSTVKIDGTLNIGGNYSVKTSAVIHEHTGLVTVGGNLSVLGNTNIKILGGAVAITGKLKLGNNGVMSGCSGRVNYGSFDINSCGFSYLKCCTSKRGTGCSNTPPPANGMDFSNCAAPPPCNSIGGTLTSNNTVCSGSNSGTLSLLGYNGSIIRWEKTTNNWSTVTIISNFTASHSYNNLSATTKFRAVIRDGACAEALSSEVVITVDPSSVGGTVNSSVAVCSGVNSGILTLSGQTGNVVRWEKSTNNWASKTNISNTTTSYTFNNLTTTTKFRAIPRSGVCSRAISSDAVISVDLPSVGGTVSSNATVCSGNNSGTLTVSGQTGSIIRWEKSSNNWGTIINLSNTSSSQSYTDLTENTKYRAIIKSGACSEATSSEVTITVNTPSVGGAVSSDATVCSGSNSGTLNLAGETGSVIRWEKSVNNWSTVIIISNTSNTQDYSDLTETTKYRAIIKSGVCSEAISSEVTITVDEISVGGTLSSSASVCSGANSGTLTLSGETGNIIRWEKTTSNWASKTNISNTSASHTFNNLTTTTKFRAIIRSGVCSRAISNVVIITVDPISLGGDISSDATICSGDNSGILTLSGETGSIVRWEKTTNNWSDIDVLSNSTNTQDYSNLTETTKYRAIIKSGTCSEDNSTEATLTVDLESVGGSVSSDSTICSGNNSGTLTVSGEVGSVLRWEKSVNNWSTTISISNTSNTQDYNDLTETTKYRAIIQSGVCSEAISSEATITVDVPTVGGVLSSDATVCSGNNSLELNLSGNVGRIVRWQKTTSTWAEKDNILNTTNNQDITNLTETTKYRVFLRSGVCPRAFSNVIFINVDEPSTGGALTTESSNVCFGDNTGVLTVSGETGSVVRWENTTNDWGTINIISNTSNTQDYTNLTATTKYRAIIQSGVCSEASSNEVTITVDVVSLGGTLTTEATNVCFGDNSGTLTVSGETGNVVRWESTTNDWGTVESISNTTNTQDYTNLTATTKYRAIIQSGVCSEASSNEVTITVDEISKGGALTTEATNVCFGDNSGTLTVSGETGSIIRWESSTNEWSTVNPIVNTTSTQDYINLTSTTKYRAIIQSGVCLEASSNEVTITVDEVSKGGLVTASESKVCSGDNSGTLTLSGETGSVVRWESTTNDWSSIDFISNTTNTQDYTNLTTSTKYRAIIQSGICSEANSNEVTVTVDEVSIGGTVSTIASNVCSGDNSGILTVSGETGSVIRWETTTNDWSLVTSISNISNTQDYNNLTATTKYRAIIQSGECSETNSNEATILVDPISEGGTITSIESTVCSGDNSGELIVSGATGSVVRWEITTDDWETVNTISNTTKTQYYNDLTLTSKYRVVIQSGVCSEVSSDEFTITVDEVSKGGTVNTSEFNVCSGKNTGILTVSGETGSVIRWETSTNSWETVNIISNTSNTQDYTNLTSTTKYRAIIQSGVCMEANSNEVIINVDEVSKGGTISASTSNVCLGDNSGILSLSGETGDVLHWERTTDDWSTVINIPSTKIAQDYKNLMKTTKFRAIIKSGACLKSSSNETTIIVNELSVGGTLTTSKSNVCFGDNSGILTVGGESGSVVRWESTTNDWSTVEVISNLTNTQNYSNLTTTTKYRAIIQSGVCSEASSNEVTIIVDEVSTGGTITTSESKVCSGDNSGTLTVSGETGSVVRWETTTNDWVTINIISNTTNTQDYTNLTATTKYRAIIQSGACSEASSDEIIITVDEVTTGGTLTTTASNVCLGDNSGTLTVSGEIGSVVRWESTTDSWETVNIISNTTNTYNYKDLLSTTKYRAIIQSGVCSEANSNELTITVDAVSKGGTLTATSSNACSGDNAGTLTISGKTGLVVRWESTSNDWSTVDIISNTSDTQDYLNLTKTTIYRAIIQSGACSEASSNEVTIKVDEVSIGGVSSTSLSNVCLGDNAGVVSISGHMGDIVRWEKTIDDWSTVTSISNTINVQAFEDLVKTTKYRAIIKSGVCLEAVSNETTVIVDEISIGGMISTSSENVCSGSNSGILKISDEIGDIVRWENTTNDWGTVNVITNTTNTQNYINLSEGTSYRAIIQSGTCLEAISTVATINVDPPSHGGILSKDTSVCLGSNSGDLILKNQIGDILRWEFSTNDFISSTTISNTEFIQSFSNLTITTNYRAVVKSGVCITNNSNEVVITVNNLPTIGLKDSVKLCLHKTLFISSSKIDGSYDWNTGQTTQEIKIEKAGKYWIDVKNEDNCSNSDTVDVYNGSNFKIDLGNDTTICFGNSLELNAGDYPTEIWMEQDTATVFYASSKNYYDVIAIDEEGCFGRDTILVNISPVPSINIVQDDSLKICEFAGEEINLNIEDDEGMDIYWNSISDNSYITVSSKGNYIASKVNQFSCVGYDTVTVISYCKPVLLNMPNVITPNGDGQNDFHVPIESISEDEDYLMNRIAEITYSVRNRWGKLIHDSQGIPSWDGRNQISGEESPPGTYFWMLHYKDASGGDFRSNGYVQLSR